VNAIVPSWSSGWADAWQWVGSIDLKLDTVSTRNLLGTFIDILLSKEISEEGNCVLAVSNELLLGLLTIVLFSVNIGQNGRNLTICNQLAFFLHSIPPLFPSYLPPSSLAITSALSSTEVKAIELLEFPKEIPIACRSAGVVPAAESWAAIFLFLRVAGRVAGRLK